jgi:hypothetical protein
MRTTSFNPFGVSKLGEMTLIPYKEKNAGKTFKILDPETKLEAKE